MTISYVSTASADVADTDPAPTEVAIAPDDGLTDHGADPPAAPAASGTPIVRRCSARSCWSAAGDS